MKNEVAADCGNARQRLDACGRREQLLRTAAAEFAKTGLRATTTVALATAAGVSEPILYAHFAGKESLFKEAVRSDSQARLRAFRRRLESVSDTKLGSCLEQMAEATISISLAADRGPLVMNWALMEAPDFATELQRDEIGAVIQIWETELKRLVTDSRRRLALSTHILPYAVHACYSYGLWLTALRHTHNTAADLTRQFAARISQSACLLLEQIS
jgi:AcrR family transcriptional regulator